MVKNPCETFKPSLSKHEFELTVSFH